jgi:hypothetical protein
MRNTPKQRNEFLGFFEDFGTLISSCFGQGSNKDDASVDEQVAKEDRASKPAEQKESQTLEDILGKNGIYYVNFDQKSNILRIINGNPWILNEKRLENDLSGYIKANLYDENLRQFNESELKKQNNPNRYLALLEIACEVHFKNKDLPSKIDNLKRIIREGRGKLEKIQKQTNDQSNSFEELDLKSKEVIFHLKDEEKKYIELQKVNIQKIATPYKNEKLKNNIKDDWGNAIFYAMTTLSSSLLCCPGKIREAAPRAEISNVSIEKWRSGRAQLV